MIFVFGNRNTFAGQGPWERAGVGDSLDIDQAESLNPESFRGSRG
jgi:hypothetical protein